MSDGDALLEAIQQAPDDDALRLVYADWLDDTGELERAKFIRVQIEAEQHLNGSPEHKRLTDCAVELLRKHGIQWGSGYETAIPADADLAVRKAHYWTDHGIGLLMLWFSRGFVDAIDLTPEIFFSLGPSDIPPPGPLPGLRLQVHNRYDSAFGALECYVQRLASSPLLCRFRDIRIHGGFSNTTNNGLRLLAKEPTLLAKLGGLLLSADPVGDPGILPVLKSPYLTRLGELAIDGTECSEAALGVLVRSDRFRSMTSLCLSGVIEGARGLRVFAAPGRWPRLRCLALAGCGLDDLTLRGLMRPGAFPVLEMLDLSFSNIHFATLRALLRSGAVPRLRTLAVGGNPLTLGEGEALRAEFGRRVDIHFPVPHRHRPGNMDTPTE